MAIGTRTAELHRGCCTFQIFNCCWVWVLVAGSLLNSESGFRYCQAQEQTRPTERNSTKKLRVQPSKIAARIGSAVNWRESLAAAQKESRETGRPIFWYVNTVPDTFTDRKIEIDRYMLAGPFSWPKIIELLNSDFIPVRQAPDAKLSQAFDLRPYDFVEPGFLVFDANNHVVARVDHLTTLAPQWLLRLFRAYNGKPQAIEELPNESIWSLPADSVARTTFESFMARPRRADLDLSVFDGVFENMEQRLEAQLMKGMVQYYSGDHATAQATWRAAVDIDPNHPLAWKAAAEREGFGPFVRGFEVLGPLPSRAWSAGIDSVGSAAPPDCYSQAELWQRGVAYLLAMQRQDGAVIDSDYDFGGTDGLPNVHVAVTSLVGLALLEARAQLPEQKTELDSALARAADFVRNEQNINEADRDEILWAYAYRLRFLAARFRTGEEQIETIHRAVSKLESVQGHRGSWYHEYSNPFVTATALVALADAKQVGANINQDVVDKGLKSLLRDRYGNGAYPYSSGRGNQSNQAEEGDIPGSAGRMPICELALFLWGRSDQKRLQFAMEQSLEHHDKLSIAYKYDNHTSALSYGGFFFWYDMDGRTEAIRYLTNQEAKTTAAKQQQQLVLALPEIDGCFVDSHELGRCYGTAMALQSMGGLSRVLDTKPN